MQKLRLLAVVSFVLLLIAACGTAGDEPETTSEDDGGDAGSETAEATGLLAAVQDAGVLRVSTDPAYPPQSSVTKGGEYEGFDIDVATEIAERLGVEIEWETPSWDVITAGNWAGRWDASVGSMTVTPERAEVLEFTPAYYFTPAAVAVHEDNSSITDTENALDGATVGVCGGCTYEAYLEKTLDIPGYEIDFVIDNASVKAYDTDSSAIADLELGDGTRLDAVISALPTLEGAIDKGKPIKLVGEPIYYEPLAVAIDKNAPEDPLPLAEEIGRIIEEMHEDGTLSELSMKWYDTDLTKET
ncbi:MAG: transporter substrate-binding domain-containing protein [Actinomycetota bacterium]